MTNDPGGPARTVLRLFLPFALAYFLSYLFRTANAVVAEDLARDLGADAASLGFVTGAYMIGFAAMQLPLGILLDRFGPRRVLSGFLLFAAAGAVGMGLARGIGELALARGLVGVGVAGCLMSSFQSNVLWFARERLPLANNAVLVAGTLGALAATTPMAALAGELGWRGAFHVLGAATLAVAALVFLAVPEPARRPGAGENLAAQLAGMRTVFTSGYFWRLGPVAVAVQATHAAYISLWAGPWLREVSGLDRAAVAQHLQVIPLAMIAGYLATGWLAARLPRLGVKPVAIVSVTVGLFLLNLVWLLLPAAPTPYLQWGLFGLLATGSVLPYSLLSQAFPAALAGRVNTGLNLLTFGSAFLVGWIMGIVIDAAGHQAAMAGATLLCAAAWVWLLVSRARPG